MNIDAHHAEVLAGWLRRVNPRGRAEEDAIASTIHALESFAQAERVAAAKKILRG